MTSLRAAVDIEDTIDKFLEDVKPLGRDASFDYCFNYFQRFREENRISDLAKVEHLQESCLQLGFYLASWGMFRPSSFLFRNSVKIHEQIIHLIAAQPPRFWEIDADTYTRENIRCLLDFRGKFGALPDPDHRTASDTLVTKIMLGIFGNVPAFDTNFRRGFRGYGCCTLGERSLEAVGRFYIQNAQVVERRRGEMYTIDFNSGRKTRRLYSRAKVIDMIFFTAGEGLNA
ncbi:MAG TPA: hypothetical protein VKM93_27985 [Terriglobia bacterium]|nr:hypothetical protein [Terriglobia bacterium]